MNIQEMAKKHLPEGFSFGVRHLTPGNSTDRERTLLHTGYHIPVTRVHDFITLAWVVEDATQEIKTMTLTACKVGDNPSRAEGRRYAVERVIGHFRRGELGYYSHGMVFKSKVNGVEIGQWEGQMRVTPFSSVDAASSSIEDEGYKFRHPDTEFRKSGPVDDTQFGTEIGQEQSGAAYPRGMCRKEPD